MPQFSVHEKWPWTYKSLADVQQAFTSSFRTLKRDLEDIQGVTSYAEMLATIRKMELFPAQQKASVYGTRLNGIFLAVDAFTVYMTIALDASEVNACAHWQAMLWGSMTHLLVVHHGSNYCTDQALCLIEDLTVAPCLRQFAASSGYSIVKSDATKANMRQILAEIACTLAGAIIYLRLKPPEPRARMQRTMLKLEAEEAEHFQRASARITKHTSVVLKASTSVVAHDTGYQLKLPFSNVTSDMLSRRFYGRDTFIADIESKLALKQRGRNFHLALHGLPGIGKSQLALRYALNTRKYAVIIWVTATNERKIQETLARAARGMRLPGCDSGSKIQDCAQSLLSWLENTDQRWLIVYDNVDEVAILDAFKVTSDNGHILITSRDPNSGVHPVKDGIRVSPFSLEDSRMFFFNNIGTHDMSKVPANLYMWLQEWDGHPMAIDQMASFIRERDLSLQAFSTMYEMHRSKVHHMHDTYAREWEYHNTMATAFSIRELGFHSRTLLHAMCFLDPDRIYNECGLFGDEQEKGVLLNLFHDQWLFFEVVQELRKRSLIQLDGTHLKIHRVVQAVSFEDMNISERHLMFRKVIGLIAAVYPEHITGSSLTDQWNLCDRYSSHVEYLLSNRRRIYQGSGCDMDDSLRKLSSICTWYMFERGLFSEADRLLNSVQPLLMTDDLQSASLRFNHCGIRAECNRITEAKVMIDEVVAVHEKLLESDNPTLGNTYYSAGIIYMELGHLDIAFDFHSKAQNVQRLAQDLDKLQVAATLENIAHCYLRAHELQKAAECAEEACKLVREAEGKLSAHYAESLFDFGNVRTAQHRFDEAFEMHQEALNLRVQLIPTHDKTGHSHHKMASLLYSRGKFIEALEHIDKAIAIYERNFDHQPRSARSKFKKSQILDELGLTKSASQVRAEAAQLRESIETFEVGLEEDEQAYDALICSWFR